MADNSEKQTSEKNLQRKLSTKGLSLYQVMDLEKGATNEEIKKKYRYYEKINLLHYKKGYRLVFTWLKIHNN